MDAFYLPDGDRLVPTELTRGPWSPEHQHAGPPSGLLARALERCEPRDGFEIARITNEILRPVPLAPLTISAQVVRGGRSVELLEATLADERGPLMLARAWRMRTATADVPEDVRAGGPSVPGPDAGGDPEGGFLPAGSRVSIVRGIDFRFVHGGFNAIGPCLCWFRLRQPLVAGETPSGLQRTLVAADFGNGISSALDFRRFIFINTDLTVALHRQAAGEWVALDAVTFPEPNGVGLTLARLHDTRGPIGQSSQSLLISARS